METVRRTKKRRVIMREHRDESPQGLRGPSGFTNNYVTLPVAPQQTVRRAKKSRTPLPTVNETEETVGPVVTSKTTASNTRVERNKRGPDGHKTNPTWLPPDQIRASRNRLDQELSEIPRKSIIITSSADQAEKETIRARRPGRPPKKRGAIVTDDSLTQQQQ